MLNVPLRCVNRLYRWVKIQLLIRNGLMGALGGSGALLATLLLLYVLIGMSKSQEHVIVVGGGLAGLSAAVEAAQAGANVTLLDKEAKLGGNSAKATSGINGAGTPVQKTRGIKDGPDLLFADTMAAGDNQNDPELVDALAHESASSVAWLTDLGINLDDVNLCGGHSVARTHWLPPLSEGRPINVGMAIINGVKAKLESLAKEAPSTQKIEIVGNAKAKGLIYNADSKHVSGVKAVLPTYPDTEVEITGRVVLASGGYSSAESLLNEFNSDKEAAMLPTTNGAFANGDGVEMARAIGAQLVDMQHVQIHPTAFIDPASPDAKTKFLAAEALRGKGAILLNEQGERFANELDRRDVLTAKIMKHCALNHEAGGVHTAWMLLPDGAVDAFGRATFAFYAKVKKFFHSFNSIEELAKFTSMDLETLKTTIADYNTYVSGAEKDPFGKTVFPARYPDDSFPWHVARITPAVHYTMGGVKIDEQGRVIGADDIPIPGLYAAGEVTGGVHGTNRLGGMWVIFGIIFVGMFAAALGYFPFSLHFY